jgi:hypothetical protein
MCNGDPVLYFIQVHVWGFFKECVEVVGHVVVENVGPAAL